ncbi:MAG TPA: choice-of-anchor tandem repeat GloVer-containing protein [Terriglobia bacterium]|nr:choice-of-anchor tandem repeat GloVer-containing protein [Terriglobia bacterium]
MSRLNWGKTTYAVLLLGAVTALASRAQTFSTLYDLCSLSNCADGFSPYAGLVQASDGNLYGVATRGGADDGGTAFKITLGGTLTTIFNFCYQTHCAAHSTQAALVQATNGEFYGTSPDGGAYGEGSVFEITPAGKLTTLYSFCAQSGCLDGGNPESALVQGNEGNLYGTAIDGGANGYGTIFRIAPSGTLTTLYSFCSEAGCPDGVTPWGGLAQGTDGNFYGTTLNGGDNGYGTVFKVTPSGTLTTLHEFCSQINCPDGANPRGTMVQGVDGNFYGTTFYGGATGYGTVFSITRTGTLTTLYSFCSQSGCADGAEPYAGLVQGTDGNFYGTTWQGGIGNCAEVGCGTIFKTTPSGMLTTLYAFCSQKSCPDGDLPEAALTQDTDGNFYGTTANGGTATVCPGGCGTIFRLSAGLGPFVRTQPGGGKVGAGVKILGTNLTGATSVTFNGTPATFTVEASSVIKATVPAGATSGTVEVVTPSGTLSSNVPFRVAP